MAASYRQSITVHLQENSMNELQKKFLLGTHLINVSSRIERYFIKMRP